MTKIGFNVNGIDISEKWITEAKEKCKTAGLDIDFILGDVESLELCINNVAILLLMSNAC